MKSSPEWDLVNSKIVEVQWLEHEMSTVNQTFIKCSLHLVRKPLFYTIYILLPTIAITSKHRLQPTVSLYHLENLKQIRLFLGMVISVFHSPSMGGEKITLSISGARSLSPWNWRATSHSCLILFILCSYQVSPCESVASTDILSQSGFRPDATDLDRYTTCVKVSYVFNGPRFLVSCMLGKMFAKTLFSISICNAHFHNFAVCISNVHHRTPAIHTMPDWLHSLFLDTLPNVLLMKKPIVPKPIFPVGHRFSISNEYPHQFNTYVPPEPPQQVQVKPTFRRSTLVGRLSEPYPCLKFCLETIGNIAWADETCVWPGITKGSEETNKVSCSWGHSFSTNWLFNKLRYGLDIVQSQQHQVSSNTWVFFYFSIWSSVLSVHR